MNFNNVEYAGCRGCIYEKCRRISQSKLEKVDLVIVGEAPGVMEIVRNAPFVGPSGDLVRRVLSAVGIDSSVKIFMTNALMCRPPEGTIKKDAVLRCRQRLMQELRVVQPRIVVALGTVALQSITNDFSLKITTSHGAPEVLPEFTLMPVVHPAKVLRAPGDYKAFCTAFHYTAKLLGGGRIADPGEPVYHVVESEKDGFRASRYILANFKMVGADIETAGRDPRRDRILDIGICYKKDCVVIWPEQYIHTLYPLFSATTKCIWQNGQFDTLFLHHNNLPARIDHDTILMHYCLNENEGDHDLATLSKRFLGAKTYKDEPKKYVKKGDRGYESVPKHVLYPYLARDCSYTYQLGHVLGSLVERDPDLKKLYYETLLEASPFLARVSDNGMCLNYAYIEELRGELIKQEETLEDQILDYLQEYWDPEQYRQETGAVTAKEVFKPSSTKQLGWMLFNKLHLPKPKGISKRKLMKNCTDKEVLNAMKASHPAIPLLLQLRSTIKTRGTYVDGVVKLVSTDNRVHSFFTLYKTVTGRLSSRQPNLQNIPRDSKIKQVFCASPGHVLIEADYKGIELRVLAYLSGDENLINIFREGRDPHSEVALEMYGPGFTKDQRVRAKAVNFGIAYGRTEYTLAAEYGISVIEGRAMIAAWYRKFPQAAEYLFQCDRDAQLGRVLVSPFGRKRRFGLVNKDTVKELKNEARNFRVQGVASDLNLKAAIRMEPGLDSMDVKIVNLVHDAIMTECMYDLDLIHTTLDYMKSIMTKVPQVELNTNIPFDVDFKIGTVWGALLEEEEFWKQQEGGRND